MSLREKASAACRPELSARRSITSRVEPGARAERACGRTRAAASDAFDRAAAGAQNAEKCSACLRMPCDGREF
jgi:hypothetical protein